MRTWVTSAETPGKKAGLEIAQKTWTDKSHKGSSVSIQYPQLVSGDSSKVNNMILDTVKNYPASVYGDDYENLTLDMNYQITLNDNSLLSMVFAGLGNVKRAAHPNNTFFTLNIDVGSGKKLRLGDLYRIDENFVRIFKEQWHAQTNSEISAYIDTLTDEELMNLLSGADSAGSDVYSYLTDQNLGISLPVLHVMGDHVEITIPYHEITQNLKGKNKIFS